MSIKIGFFGDSFCSDLRNEHSVRGGYETYIEKIVKHYDAEIVNLGVGGSSVWDCVLLQFQETMKKEIPDVCVFAWTNSNRLFHRNFRAINPSSVESQNLKKIDQNLYTASKNYFHYLYDYEKHLIEHSALLHYFDRKVLHNYKNTKFIHLWSFEESMTHRWETGVELQPALSEISVGFDTDLPAADARANHLEGDIKNTLVYKAVVDAIENYQNGNIINFDISEIKND